MADFFSFICGVGAKDSLQLTKEQRVGLNRFLRAMHGGQVEATFRAYRETRSSQANRYYWGVVVPALAEHLGYQKDELHEALKGKFLSLDAEPDAHGLVRVRSTASLNTAEFRDYLEQVITWAGAEFGLDIPEAA